MNDKDILENTLSYKSFVFGCDYKECKDDIPDWEELIQEIASNYNDDDISSNNVLKVAFVIGLNNEFSYISADAVLVLSRVIVRDWNNFKDIINEEEKGYIMAYAERKILQFLKDIGNRNVNIFNVFEITNKWYS